MKIAIVAFNCKGTKSLMYKKIKVGDEELKPGEGGRVLNPDGNYIRLELGRQLMQAVKLGADFCSVRFIRGEEKE